MAANPSSQRTVVQAKFATGSEPANRLVEKTNSLSGDTLTPPEFLATKPREENFSESQRIVVSPINIRENQTTNSVGWVEARTPNTNNQTTNAVGWVEATKPNTNNQTTNSVFETTKPNTNNQQQIQ
ncbi:MAG: hypothetical protein HC942_25340 [Microcoleus sp. SU_5_6]|nr:hypothetical protein [Microcoleus sp. SU_5_6]